MLNAFRAAVYTRDEINTYLVPTRAALTAHGVGVEDIVKSVELEAPYAPVTTKESATRQ